MLEPTLKKWVDHTLLYEGSTRPVALVRMGLVFLLWTSWANDFRLNVTLNLNPVATFTGIAFFITTSLMLIGCWTRIVTALAGVTLIVMYFYLGAILKIPFYLYGLGHHQYLLVILTCLLAFTPCGKSFSLDRWREICQARQRNQSPPPERGPLWATRLMAFQISMVYFWSAYNKTTLPFLSGQRLEQMVMSFYFGSDYPRLLGFHEAMMVLAVGSVALEYTLSVGLWIPQFRRACIYLGIFFHALLYYLFDVWAFSAAMVLMYLLFLSPERVHSVMDRLSGTPVKLGV